MFRRTHGRNFADRCTGAGHEVSVAGPVPVDGVEIWSKGGVVRTVPLADGSKRAAVNACIPVTPMASTRGAASAMSGRRWRPWLALGVRAPARVVQFGEARPHPRKASQEPARVQSSLKPEFRCC